jgi:hypothetical protein
VASVISSARWPRTLRLGADHVVDCGSAIDRRASAVDEVIRPIAVIDQDSGWLPVIGGLKLKVATLLSASLALVLCLATLTVIATDDGCTTTRDGRVVCPKPDSRCVTDDQGEVICSTPGGGIEFDRYGVPVCGPGYCTRDQRGELFCSSVPRGAAATDRSGNAACSVSCVPATPQACIKLRSSK